MPIDQAMQQVDTQMWGRCNFVHGYAQQIAITQSLGLAEFEICEWFAKALIRAQYPKQSVFTLLIETTQLDHSSDNDPNMIRQQRD
jgi:hypothetical protein